jgi:DNA-binding transcriptional regulator YiaG
MFNFTGPPMARSRTYMPNIAKVLREETQRLARKEVRAGLSPLKRDTVRLKKSVADLRRQLAALSRTSSELLKKVTPVVAAQEGENATERAARLRPTSKSLEKLRRRLGLTQVRFGTLLGVSGPAVVRWASQGGRVRMRNATLSALAEAQHMGKREALRRLEAMAGPKPVRKGRRQP